MTTFAVSLILVFILGTAGAHLAGPKGWLCGVCLGVFVVLAGTTPGGLIVAVILLIAAAMCIEAYMDRFARSVTKTIYGVLDQMARSFNFWRTVADTTDQEDWWKRGKELYLNNLVILIKLMTLIKDQENVKYWESIKKTIEECADCDPPYETYFYDPEEMMKHVSFPKYEHDLLARLKDLGL